MAITCSTCKFWGRGDESEWFEPVDDVTVRFCANRMVCRESDGVKMQGNGVYTADEGGVTGELMTGPQFGCIHHKNRE